MNATRANFLQHASVMVGLDDEAIRYLSDLAGEERYLAGTVIVAEGEPGNRMFFLAAGRVVVVKDHGKAHPVVLAELGPGEFFGEMRLVESVVRSASVVAAEAVTVCTLKGTDLHRLYEQRPGQYGIVMLNLARDLSRRLRGLDDRFAHISH